MSIDAGIISFRELTVKKALPDHQRILRDFFMMNLGDGHFIARQIYEGLIFETTTPAQKHQEDPGPYDNWLHRYLAGFDDKITLKLTI